MKKLLVLLLATTLALSAACAPQTDGGAKKLGLIQLADNGAFTLMREGFIQRMTELGYDEKKLQIDYKNASGDIGALNSICQSMASDKDIIVTIATPPTQAIVALEPKAPVFFISVSNPVAAGVITDMQKPDKNATGTSNAIPVSEVAKFAESLTPGIETFGILYNNGEINAVTTADNMKKYLDESGIAYKEAVVTSSSEVAQAAQSLMGSIDALFVPNDSMIQSAMPQVAEIAKEAGVPVYGSSQVMVESGALATISIDDTTIGRMTADMVAEYLGGKAVSDIPAVVVSEFTTIINRQTADAIGAAIPDDILADAVIIE